MYEGREIIKDYSIQEVVELIKNMNQPSYRADQLLEWVYGKKVLYLEEMSNLPVSLREELKEKILINTLEVKEKRVSPRDGTEKYLLRALDGELLECAVMKQEYGNTVCVSSQVGCGLACVFCASAKGGLVRNLSPGEMLDQVILAEKHLDGSGKIKNIVVMGMGEPLLNLSGLVRFLKTANHPRGLGLGFRNMSVSTAGIPPKMEEFAREEMPVTLAVSLHAPDNETRSQIMPVNKKHPVEEVLEACRNYIEKVGRRATFEYMLVDGFNDSKQKARELAGLLKGMLCHVNLIPANPTGEKNIKRPDKKRIKNFMEVLENHNISVSIRKERGEDIEGACGQLRRRSEVGS